MSTTLPLTDPRVPRRTPWGSPDEARQLIPGMVEVSTPSHGGIHLAPELNAKVHEAWRNRNGWYEEDCAWAIVAVTFPDAFPGTFADEQAQETSALTYADQVARAYYPDEYAAATGREVLLSESYVLQERAFFAEHAADLLVRSASGRDDGLVEVVANVGGRANPDTPLLRFLVPADEYRAGYSTGFSFIVDPARHTAVADEPQHARSA